MNELRHDACTGVPRLQGAADVVREPRQRRAAGEAYETSPQEETLGSAARLVAMILLLIQM